MIESADYPWDIDLILSFLTFPLIFYESHQTLLCSRMVILLLVVFYSLRPEYIGKDPSIADPTFTAEWRTGMTVFSNQLPLATTWHFELMTEESLNNQLLVTVNSVSLILRG